MSLLVVALAVFVLVVMVCQLQAADPSRARAAPIRWHLWALARITVATGMVARIATVLRPSVVDEQTAALLTLAGVALLVGVVRRRTR